MSLREQNVPSTDLSDLNAPAPARGRGGGALANLIAQPTPPVSPNAKPPTSEDVPTDEPGLESTGDEFVGVAPPASIISVRQSSQLGSVKKGKPISGVYVAEGVKKRFEKFRYDNKLTNVQVVLRAVSSQRDKLAQIIEQSKYDTAPAAPGFSSDPSTVKYIGGGSAQVTFKPTLEQAAELDAIGDQIGFDKRSTWLAPVLNSFLPGRKETKRE